MSSEVTVDEAINYYYALKNKYETNIQNKKDRIIENTLLSRKEKREKILQIEKKCILCKKEGGTVFSNKNRTLKAVCGSNPPCSLNIEIKLGRTMSGDDSLKMFDEAIEADKLDIIKTKLDLLFNFITESEAIKKFEDYRVDFLNDSKIREELLIEVLNETNNPDKQLKREALTVELYENILEVKRLVASYKSEEKSEYLTEAMETYTGKIVPLEAAIRKLKYNYNIVDIDLTDKIPIYNIIEKPYTLADIELLVSAKNPSKIINYEINLTKKKKEKEVKPIKPEVKSVKPTIAELPKKNPNPEGYDDYVRLESDFIAPQEVDKLEKFYVPKIPYPPFTTEKLATLEKRKQLLKEKFKETDKLRYQEYASTARLTEHVREQLGVSEDSDSSSSIGPYYHLEKKNK